MLIEGDVILRPLKYEDKGIMAVLANNKRIADNLRDAFPHPYDESHAEFFINLSKKKEPPANLAIEYKGEFCGVIGLVKQEDVYSNTAEIGYWVGEPFWNKGIASTAVKLMTDYGFNELGFIRIHTGIFEYNVASMKVLEKNGYKKEGVFKSSVFKNGQIWDEHRYAIWR